MIGIINGLKQISAKLVEMGWDEELFAPLELEYVDDQVFVLMRSFDANPNGDVWFTICFGPGNSTSVSVADADDLDELRDWRQHDIARAETPCPVCRSYIGNHVCPERSAESIADEVIKALRRADGVVDGYKAGVTDFVFVEEKLGDLVGEDDELYFEASGMVFEWLTREHGVEPPEWFEAKVR